MSAKPGGHLRGPTWLRDVEAVTLDFGNTLVPFPREQLDGVLALTAGRLAGRDPSFDVAAFVGAWSAERLRQLSLDVPEGREADIEPRARRVLATLRGCPVPPASEPWDDALAAMYCEPEEVVRVVDAYAAAFVETTPVPPEIGPFLNWLAARYRVAILSNWPLAIAIERFVDRAGWRPALTAIVVSQRVGWIKPLPAIFEAAAGQLGLIAGSHILHAGDDLGADIGGAHRVGWRAAWVRSRPADSPLPVATPSGDEAPDLVVDRVVELRRVLEPARAARVP